MKNGIKLMFALAISFAANAQDETREKTLYLVDTNRVQPCVKIDPPQSIDFAFNDLMKMYRGTALVVVPVTNVEGDVWFFHLKAPNGAPIMVTDSLNYCGELVNYILYRE